MPLLAAVSPGGAEYELVEATVSDLLGRFLRDRRAKVTLAEAGLPARRSGRPGTLTQEDLARLTGFSVRTISALEQGSNHRPSRELLDAISAALRLTPDERSTLWRLAAQTPPPDNAYRPQPDPHLGRLAELLDPHPCYVCDAVYNVHSHNRAFGEWVCDFAALPQERRNLARYLVLDPHAKHILPHWAQDLRGLVTRIRAVRALLPDSAELDALIADLLADADFRQLWETKTDVTGYSAHLVLTLREPGFTDPEQPDDDSHQVPLVMSALTPITPGDNRRFMTLMLPEGYRRRAAGSRCAACERSGRLVRPDVAFAQGELHAGLEPGV